MIGLCVVIITLPVLYFLLRNAALHYAFSRVQKQALQNFHLHITANTICFSGFNRVVIDSLTIQPENADTLLQVTKAECKISLLSLLTGKIGLDKIEVNGAYANIYNDSARNNIGFLKQRQKQTQSEPISSAVSYYDRVSNAEDKFFRAFNTAFELKDIHISYTDTTISENVLIQLQYDLHSLSGFVINQFLSDTILISGQVLDKNKSWQFSSEHLGKGDYYFPFLNSNHGVKCKFKTALVKLTFNQSSNQLQINTDLRATDFRINHWRLAENDVVCPQVQFKGLFSISDNAVELDSSSTLLLQSLPLKLFVNYHVKPDTAFAISVLMSETVSDTFFNALPGGMFTTLKGISCTGTLTYDLEFSIHTNQPDSLIFHSELKRKNFRLNHYGAVNYARINEPFVYDAYDKDRLVRQIPIGFENPMFVPLNQVSQFLPKAVLQSEDPSFMQHRGFLPESFRESVIQNYKERRFARGGSTISMQLVKNVFLKRNKTVSRKAEEALIVYLIENLAIVPKERMLEIYLNVIEWGPNVYGAGEAARFYFNKRASELTLQESIFLAGIIPMPKSFKYQFDKEGKLRSYMSGYFKILTSRMAGKGWISEIDTTGLLPEVKLKGPALRMVLPNDSTGFREEEDF